MKTQPKLRKSILLVMLRAQKPVKITVGGMLTLNLECFTTVSIRGAPLQFAFSSVMLWRQREHTVQLMQKFDRA